MNIFEILNKKYVLPQKVKLFEAFAGVGCQRLAFKRIGVECEMIGISEIDKYAIQSYMEIHGETKNYGSITDIKGQDLPKIDVFTWSFPCTDLSKAGKQKGLTNTRSGLVYEVLRILQELQETNNLPTVLIMENVVDLVQKKFINEFNEIQLELEQMGYTNYVETLNAKNYGVAQNRDRVFMVSILGDYYYEFPKPFKLEKRLKDYLEDDVEEKYYLSDKMLNTFTDMTDRNGFVRGDRFKPHDKESEYAYTITTNTGQRATDNFIKMPDATTKGYAEAYVGDGVYINRPHQKRGVVQKEMIQTLKTSGNDVGVVVNAKGVYLNESERFRTKPFEEMSRCLKAGNHDAGVIENRFYRQALETLEENDVEYGDSINAYNKSVDRSGQSPTITTRPEGFKTAILPVTNNLRIRKLTPLECWRLMGIDDEDFEKAHKVCSNSQLYKQAGNGIVVDVFAAILEMMIIGKM